MKSSGKAIKYCAFALAGVIIFAIITAIVSAVGGILMAIGIIGKKAPDLNVDCINYDKCLALSIGAAKLEIKTGDELGYTSNISDLEVTKTDNALTIRDKSKVRWFGGNGDKVITVTVPKEYTFDIVGIASGAGEIYAEQLLTKEAKIDLGAGKSTIDYLGIFKGGKIDSGVGEFTIRDGEIVDTDFALGIGKANIRAKITGKTKVDAGIGEVNLDLLYSDDAYMIRADKGIGSIRFNGSNISDNSIIGNGPNEIDVDGGIGSINITTGKESIKKDNPKPKQEEKDLTKESEVE